MLRNFPPKQDRSPVAVNGIVLSVVAAGGLAATLFWGQPRDLSADTAASQRPVGIRLQQPDFGTGHSARSAAAVTARPSAKFTETADASTSANLNTRSLSEKSGTITPSPTAPAATGRRYKADGQQLQLIYKSLKPDLPQHEIRILPRHPQADLREYREATSVYRVGQSRELPSEPVAQGEESFETFTPADDGSDVLSLPPFTLPGLPETAAEECLRDAAGAFDQPLNAPAPHASDHATPHADSTGTAPASVLPMGPDVLATIPRVVQQHAQHASPGPPPYRHPTCRHYRIRHKN